MFDTRVYRVPGISCSHCKAALERELAAVGGITAVEVDVDAKLVSVHGRSLDDTVIRAAIDAAGYEAE